MKYCYNCGEEFPNEDLTKEHIPPRCFSDVLPKEYKQQRITVWCCDACNSNYSDIDSELRDLIAILNDGRSNQEDLLEKAIRSQLHKKDHQQEVYINPETGRPGFQMNLRHIEQMFVKCHKGIFYDKYGVPADHDFETLANQKLFNEDHQTPATRYMEELHKSHPDSFIQSGHRDVFVISLLAYRKDQEGTWKFAENLDDCFAVSSYAIFLNTIDCLVASVKKESEFFQNMDNDS